ncbi:hypothetical protein QJQ45_025326 [Haematococcus lacustris]|nr:hypothetical protein QJQ45_025326 [Haematococcus lacustris]
MHLLQPYAGSMTGTVQPPGAADNGLQTSMHSKCTVASSLNAKFRLYCGKQRVVARFWSKLIKQAKQRWPDRILALAYGAASFSGSGSIGCRGVPVSQMRKEAVRQFGAGRVVLVDKFRTSRVSSAYSHPSEALPGQPPESFRWLRPVYSSAKRSQVRGLMCSTSNNIRFYDRDVSAALNIRRCAVGPGPRPTELCYWDGRPAMPKPGRPGQEWLYLQCMKEQKFEAYFGRKIAVDASMHIYQFMAVQPLVPCCLLYGQGMFYRTAKMLEAGIRPVFVFDGKPPELKRKLLDQRGERRDAADEKLKTAQEAGNTEDIEKYSKRTIKVTREHNEDCRRLLRLMGVPVVDAATEAEAQCAAMAKAGLVYGVATEDMDALTFGTPRLIRHLMQSSVRQITHAAALAKSKTPLADLVRPATRAAAPVWPATPDADLVRPATPAAALALPTTPTADFLQPATLPSSLLPSSPLLLPALLVLPLLLLALLLVLHTNRACLRVGVGVACPNQSQPIMEFDYSKALEGIKLTADQFIDFCILCGCDYATSIKGIGPVRALQLLQKHGSMDTLLAALDPAKYNVPEDWPHKESHEFFKNPEITPCETIPPLKWSEPDEEGLVAFLVGEKNFSEDRVRKTVAKIKASKGKANQGRMENFFAVQPKTPTDAKSASKTAADGKKGSTPGSKRKDGGSASSGPAAKKGKLGGVGGGKKK